MSIHPSFRISIPTCAALSAFVLLVSGCASSRAAPADARSFVYVSNGGDKQLAVYRMDETTGELTHVQTLDAGGAVGS